MKGETDEGTERVEVEVTNDTLEIEDAICTEVTDRVYLEVELIEDTLDYEARDGTAMATFGTLGNTPLTSRAVWCDSFRAVDCWRGRRQAGNHHVRGRPPTRPGLAAGMGLGRGGRCG